MNLFRSFLMFVAAQLFFMTACQHEQVEQQNKTIDGLAVVDSLESDSDALVLALTPTVECLPLYYAKQTGIFKTLGLKVKLETFTSQFDCDTAMQGITAVGGASDLIRLHYNAEKGQVMSAVTALNGQWSLLASKDLRIRKTELLRDRMVAVARFSSSDYFSGRALAQADLEYSASFRPQINDYYLRTAMLKNHQVDASVLPEPFVTQAKREGHKELFSSKKYPEQMGCLVFKPSVLAVKDSADLVRKVLEGYDLAVAEINAKGRAVCDPILRKEYKLSDDVIKNLTLPKYQKATSPAAHHVDLARRFVEDGNRWSGKISSQTLIDQSILQE